MSTNTNLGGLPNCRVFLTVISSCSRRLFGRPQSYILQLQQIVEKVITPKTTDKMELLT